MNISRMWFLFTFLVSLLTCILLIGDGDLPLLRLPFSDASDRDDLEDLDDDEDDLEESDEDGDEEELDDELEDDEEEREVDRDLLDDLSLLFRLIPRAIGVFSLNFIS